MIRCCKSEIFPFWVSASLSYSFSPSVLCLYLAMFSGSFALKSIAPARLLTLLKKSCLVVILLLPSLSIKKSNSSFSWASVRFLFLSLASPIQSAIFSTSFCVTLSSLFSVARKASIVFPFGFNLLRLFTKFLFFPSLSRNLLISSFVSPRSRFCLSVFALSMAVSIVLLALASSFANLIACSSVKSFERSMTFTFSLPACFAAANLWCPLNT